MTLQFTKKPAVLSITKDWKLEDPIAYGQSYSYTWCEDYKMFVEYNSENNWLDIIIETSTESPLKENNIRDSLIKLGAIENGR